MVLPSPKRLNHLRVLQEMNSSIPLYCVKDPDGDFYHSAVAATGEESIITFLSFSGYGKSEWVNFLAKGWSVVPVVITEL